MIRAHRSAGFLASGLLHLGVAAALVPAFDLQPGPGPVETPLNLSLNMFQQTAATVVAAEISQARVPERPLQPLNIAAPEKRVARKPDLTDAGTIPDIPAAHSEPLPARPVVRKAIPTTHSQMPAQQPEPQAALIPVPAASAARTGALTDTSVSRQVDAELDELKMRYMKALVRRIHQKKYYPSKARLKREEGEVLVAFLIERSGRIGNIHVARSSGSPSLDAAAVKTLERVNPFQALPEELEMQSWELAVPIAYHLQH